MIAAISINPALLAKSFDSGGWTITDHVNDKWELVGLWATHTDGRQIGEAIIDGDKLGALLRLGAKCEIECTATFMGYKDKP